MNLELAEKHTLPTMRRKGGETMKTAILLAVSALLVFSYGCCTRKYAREQVVPMEERIAKVETETSTSMSTANQA